MCCDGSSDQNDGVPGLPIESSMTHIGDGVYKGSFMIEGLLTQSTIFVSAKFLSPGGLKGEYTDGPTPTQNPQYCQKDETVSFNWGFDSLSPLVRANDAYVKWTGYVVPPETNTYTFSTTFDTNSAIAGSVGTSAPFQTGDVDLTMTKANFYPV